MIFFCYFVTLIFIQLKVQRQVLVIVALNPSRVIPIGTLAIPFIKAALSDDR